MSGPSASLSAHLLASATAGEDDGALGVTIEAEPLEVDPSRLLKTWRVLTLEISGRRSLKGQGAPDYLRLPAR